MASGFGYVIVKAGVVHLPRYAYVDQEEAQAQAAAAVPTPAGGLHRLRRWRPDP